MASTSVSRKIYKNKKCANCSRKIVCSPIILNHVTVYTDVYNDEMESISRASKMIETGKKRDLTNYEKLLAVE